ncbi:hypothetical protein G4B11_007736 [Aspergillus flavus]|nr:hypothetical protein G4B11_007736 [Aspergillus flavus]
MISDDAVNDKTKPFPTTRIKRSTYVVWLVLVYATLDLFSWVVLCRLTYRPVTASHYGYWISNDQDNSGWGLHNVDYVYDERDRNERWYKAAQVVQSIVSLLTIPLTTTTCSSAVVVWLQHRVNSKTPSITLRQMTVLADKGWADIPTYFRLVTTKRSRYSSSFLIWALILHVVGGLISPLQQIFLSTETIKTPTYPMHIGLLMDIPEKLTVQSTGASQVVALTRKSIESTSANDLSSQLWVGNDSCPNARTDMGDINTNGVMLCDFGGSRWGNMSLFSDPFLAELPKYFNTGLIQQFLPRFNTTARYENISFADFPTNCDTIAGALSIRHRDADRPLGDGLDSWAVHACMPNDLRKSPWRKTRARQDFTEELYLNISISQAMQHLMERPLAPNPQLFRVTLDTTAGYFELPNYMNGNKAGPLLLDSPSKECGNACLAQGMGNFSIYNHYRLSREDSVPPVTNDLEQVSNKGPLLTTALALFGNNSWLETLARSPGLYDRANISRVADDVCVDLAPLGRIFAYHRLTTTQNSDFFMFNDINNCVRPESLDPNLPTFHNALRAASWLQNFEAPGGEPILANAFTISAYLAISAWLSDIDPGTRSFMVNYDQGADTQKPSISLAGIIVMSVLVGLNLIGLFVTAIYASWFPRWTDSLNAFSLLRLGSSISDHVPLKVSVKDDEISVLDELPGWVGDDPQIEEPSHIALGGSRGLQGKRVYEAYDGKSLRNRNQRLAKRTAYRRARQARRSHRLASP